MSRVPRLLAARPCIAKRAVEIAQKTGCKFVAHGATGKGNDQVRFELTFAALDPSISAIVPWRDPTFYTRFQGRSDLMEYAAARGVPVVQTRAKPYSMDENMMHISYEAGVLEDPATAPPADMFRMTVDPMKAPDTPAHLTLTFDRGVPVRVVNTADGTGARPRSSTGTIPRTLLGCAPSCRRERPAGAVPLPQQDWRCARRRPCRRCGEPLRRHQEPRYLRVAWRRDPTPGPHWRGRYAAARLAGVAPLRHCIRCLAPAHRPDAGSRGVPPP